MRNWIAGAVTVLGVLLVLGGAGTILLRTWWKPAEGEAATTTPAQQTASELFGPSPVPPVPAAGRLTRPFARLEAAERLILWGILLLVLAAVAAGAIGFNLGADAPVK
jgi:hypothetical protein